MPQLPVSNFLFHRVHPVPDALWPPMHPILFKRIVKHLKKQFTICSLEDLYTSEPQKTPSKPFATICFDDGYLDNLTYAADILKSEQVPASFYVVTDCIDRNIPTWTYLLDFRLQNYVGHGFKLQSSALLSSLSSAPNTKAESVIWAKSLKPILKTLPHTERELILNQIATHCKDVVVPRLMMNWSQVRELQHAGFSIGSHTHTHPMLATMDNESEILFELTHSAERLETELGISSGTLSYPVGSFDARVTRLASAAGYSIGLAVEQKKSCLPVLNKMAISRIELYQEPWWKCWLRIQGFERKSLTTFIKG